MKIKEVESQAGITSHTIRFYEKERLIIPKRNIKAEKNRIRQNHLLCEQLADMEIGIQIFHDKDAYLYRLENKSICKVQF